MPHPFFFGTSERQLLGMYDPPPQGGNRGVVLCHPWGQEYLNAYKSMRHLARLLSRNGLHVLRFDYYGCGDSSGDDDQGTMKQWASDIDDAIEELKDMALIDTVSIVGLRLGATLAVLCSLQRNDVDSLVLWDPIVVGSAYRRELLDTDVSEPQDRSGGRQLHVNGFPLTEALADELDKIDLSDVSSQLPPSTIVMTIESSAYDRLQAALSEAGTPVSAVLEPGPSVWIAAGDFASAGMPVAALERIAEEVCAA